MSIFKILFAVILAFSLLINPKTYEHVSAVSDDNILFLQESSNYNYKFSGENENDWLGYGHTNVADLNNNGKNDLIIPAGLHDSTYNDVVRTSNGSVYLIFDSLLSTNTGSLSLGDPETYNLRIDGAELGDELGMTATWAYDIIGNDGKKDLILGAYKADNNYINAGTIYIIDNSIFAAYTTTGNILDLSEEANYSYRINGHFEGAYISKYLRSTIMGDFDYDGKIDVAVSSADSDNDFTNSGSVFIVTNTIINSSPGKDINLDEPSSFLVRFDGGSSEYLGQNIKSGDFDGDGKTDLVLGARNYNSRAGAAYIIMDEILSGFSGTGNTSSLQAGNNNFNIRFSGPTASADLSFGSLDIGDIDSDGLDDLLLTGDVLDYNGTSSGSTYIILNSILSSTSGYENDLPLSSVENYTIRVDGEAASHALNFGNALVFDYKNDGNSYKDLLFYGLSDYNSLSNSGSVYLIYGETLFNHINAGTKSINLADTDNYDMRFDGEYADGYLGYFSLATLDVNNDQKNDLLMSAFKASVGYSYIYLNYPHSISAEGSGSYAYKAVPLVKGTVAAATSVTDIAGVEWSTTNSESGNWNSCSPDDGVFDSKSENYTCTISGLSPQTVTVYVRSFDTTGSYTHPSGYSALELNLQNTSAPGSDGAISPCSPNALFAPTIHSLTPNYLNDAVTLKYSSPGKVDHYDISYGTNNLFQWTAQIPANQTTYTISYLIPGISYQFKIRGVTTCNVMGPWSVIKTTNSSDYFTSIVPTINPNNFQELNPNKEAVIDNGNTETIFPPKVDGYTLTLTVKDTKNKAVSGAAVEIHSEVKQGITNSEGKITFEGLTEGEHTVFITYGNFKGEEKINLEGNTKSYEITVVVEEKVNLLTKLVLAISLFTVIFLIYLRRNKKVLIK